MPLIARKPPLIEAFLVRKSVDALAERRTRCAHCRRSPLVGERIYFYAAGAGERVVCELCRHLRREAPARSELVHSTEHELCVRRLAA
jgi:hypothetical protein